MACKFGNYEIVDMLVVLVQISNLSYNNDLPLPLHHLVSNKLDNNSELEKSVRKMLKLLKDNGISLLEQLLSARDLNDYTALHIAIQNNYYNLVKILIEEYGSKINLPCGQDKNLPIHLSAQVGSTEIFDLLVKYNSNIEETNSKNENCLHIAAISNKPKFIEHFLKVEYQLKKEYYFYKCTNWREFTPLLAAANSSNLDCVKKLTSQNLNFDLSDRDIDDQTVFHLSAKPNNFKCFIYLLDLVDSECIVQTLMLKDKYDNTILHTACKYGNYELVEYILKMDQKYNTKKLIFQKNYYEQSCFHICCKEGHENLVNYLIKEFNNNKNKLLDDQDDDLNTPLHLACLKQKEEVVRILLENGANVNAINAENSTPLNISCSKINLNIFELLIQYKSPINILNKVKSNENVELPIHIAAKTGNTFMFNYLLQVGADPSIQNSKKQTALDIAIKKENAEIVEILLNSPNWASLIGLANNENENKRFKMLNAKMPHLTKIIIDKLIENKEKQEFCFRSIDPSFSVIKEVDNHPLFIISQTERDDLLNHPAVRELVKLKWNSVPRKIFYSNLFFYFLFLLLLTYHILWSIKIDLNENDESNEILLSRLLIKNTNTSLNASDLKELHLSQKYLNSFHTTRSTFFLSISIGIVLLHITKEVFEIIYKGYKYFFMFDNVIELTTYILTFIYFLPSNSQLKVYNNEIRLFYIKNSIQWSIGSLCALFSWIGLALFLQKVPKFGIFAIMFEKMLIKSLKILPVFLILLTGFSISFSLNKKHDLRNFKTMTFSIVSVMEMMVGGGSNELSYDKSFIKQMVFFLFMGLMCIMVLNLLIAIAIGEIKNFYEEADIMQMCMKIKYILNLQKILYSLMGDDHDMVFEKHSKALVKKDCLCINRKKLRKFLYSNDKRQNNKLFKDSEKVLNEDVLKNFSENLNDKFEKLNSTISKMNNELELIKEKLNGTDTRKRAISLNFARPK